MKLKYKLIFVFFTFCTFNVYALNVIVAKSNIKYKEKINSSKLKTSTVSKVKKHCKPLSISIYNSNTFTAKHFIRKGDIICLNDIKVYKKESVIFQFGALEIEKEGKILFQNKKYITIKKSDGKTEKIYKDGKIR